MPVRELVADRMTPRERGKAFAEGQPIDRIPFSLNVGDHAAGLIGAKVSELHLSADRAVEAQLAAVRIYRQKGSAWDRAWAVLRKPSEARLDFRIAARRLFPDMRCSSHLIWMR